MQSAPYPTHTLSLADQAILNASLRDSKIKQAMFSFKPLKAPGPDGLHPMFYQKYWNVLGEKVICYCKEVFLSHEKNTTYLCVTPKCANAIILKNYRPIGLSNTMYKLITKS